MTNEEEIRLELVQAIEIYTDVCKIRDSEFKERHNARVEYRAKIDLYRTAAQAAMSASLEHGLRTGEGVHPDWIYEARDAIRHCQENVPWLVDLLDALGWKGGSAHAAIQAVRRLVAAEGTGWQDVG